MSKQLLIVWQFSNNQRPVFKGKRKEKPLLIVGKWPESKKLLIKAPVFPGSMIYLAEPILGLSVVDKIILF